MPTHWAAMMMRLESRISMAYRNPRPSSPSRFSEGTGVSWNTTSLVLDALMPILPCWGVMVSPGDPWGTMKALMPRYPWERSWVANTTMDSAISALVIKCLVPLRNQVPSRIVAVVWRAAASDPPPGSVNAQAATPFPDANDGRNRCFCSSLPNRAMVEVPRDRWAMRVTLADESPRAVSSAAMATWR